MVDVVSIGELLIDFISPEAKSLEDVEAFTKCFGGAPANFAVGCARLGIDVGLISDIFRASPVEGSSTNTTSRLGSDNVS